MLIMLQANQIPAYWEKIRIAGIKSDLVEKDFEDAYCINLLYDLLSGKKTCFVHIIDNILQFVIMISFQYDAISDRKTLMFDNLYGFYPQSDDVWKKCLMDLIAVGKKENCYNILGKSINDRIREILKTLNIDSKYSYYEYVI